MKWDTFLRKNMYLWKSNDKLNSLVLSEVEVINLDEWSITKDMMPINA